MKWYEKQTYLHLLLHILQFFSSPFHNRILPYGYYKEELAKLLQSRN